MVAGKSQKIFGSYDQAALDRAYFQRCWAPNCDEIIQWYTDASAKVYARMSAELNIPYGDSADERFDLFRAANADAPVLVFVHGGAWQALTKEDSVFPAELFVGAGVSYIALNFGVVPSVRLPDMVGQVQRAIAWLWRNGKAQGINSDRLYLCGHSSGAHLAAMALFADWQSLGLPRDILKGGLCASGSYDLEAVMLSYRGKYLQLNKAEEAALSPIHFVERLACPVAVAYGDQESPEFQRQACEFHRRIENAGGRTQLLVAKNLNHFEISKTLASPDGFLARVVLNMVGLSPRE